MFGPTTTRSAARRGRLILGALVAAGVLAGSSAPDAAADWTHMHCNDQGNYCWWGYNLVGPTTNERVHAGWNYWDDQYIDKTSGGNIFHGFYPSPTCYHSIFGAGWWYGYPSDLGCGGYIYPYTMYNYGNTSYLYFDDFA